MTSVIAGLLTGALLALAPIVQAAEVTVSWDASPVAEEVTHYTVWVDGVNAAEPTDNQQVLDLEPGIHEVTVTAHNLWASSEHSEMVTTPPVASIPANVRVTVTVTVTVTVNP